MWSSFYKFILVAYSYTIHRYDRQCLQISFQCITNLLLFSAFPKTIPDNTYTDRSVKYKAFPRAVMADILLLHSILLALPDSGKQHSVSFVVFTQVNSVRTSHFTSRILGDRQEWDCFRTLLNEVWMHGAYRCEWWGCTQVISWSSAVKRWTKLLS